MSLVAQWVEEFATRANCRDGATAGAHGLQLTLYYGGKRAELPPAMSPHRRPHRYGTVQSEYDRLIAS